ncbi:hypothetical protein BABINDRAFT_38761 [Babjeviella inositovora NRRL Y-12698]|uniref:non-specific serine/threonine protein kinase n=1 Tax=Babjeviella inositovora NRRL Y-12698 TaxID=984486 RepID=A0A1E3QMJ9_9ASCO|nr:uncharacterized protein BABINDRAFT_38761 [Babjeviella inositovora NRRL Y-12698]ODQ78913.1 hypothetical protein BABINDRAFT_38761 [Babjeviella inositovora NRRL Y-12698]
MPNASNQPTSHSPVKITAQKNTPSVDLQEILKFPTESTHAYSYAQLSSNSLALRLNVLKRSLEILVERPDLLVNLNGISSPLGTPPSNDYFSVTTQSQPYQSPSFLRSALSNSKSNSHIQGNASSAALAALFRAGNNLSLGMSSADKTIIRRGNLADEIADSPMPNEDLKSIIKLLNKGKDNTKVSLLHLLQDRAEMATNLHDLSLSSGELVFKVTGKAPLPSLSREAKMKIKLLHALATPFVENNIGAPVLSLNPIGASSLALSSLQHSMTTANLTVSMPRTFHNIFSQKNTNPQAVFTCELDAPWALKAANDLSCLMFGISRLAIRAMALMDLIAPQSRSLVMDRLTSLGATSTMFAGEIVAVSRPGNGYAWTSLWGKKKDNMIILMFDQISCDAMDLTIRGVPDTKGLKYVVTEIKEHSGTLVARSGLVARQPMSRLSSSIAKILQQPLAAFLTPEERDESADIRAKRAKMKQYQHLPRNGVLELEIINDRRYFTLQIQNQNIPCAIRSNVIDSGYSSEELDLENTNQSVKLKIHSMPYIAGIVVVSAQTFQILSFNPAITKNLFGRADVRQKSIDVLLPNFSLFLKEAIKQNNVVLTPGLVLPEHFFRKAFAAYQAKGSGKMGKQMSQEAELLFLNSFGVEGRHFDGNVLKLDVQLRVSGTETFVLWITYSRSLDAAGVSETDPATVDTGLQKDPSAGARVLFQDVENVLVEGDAEVIDVPSQMKLYSEHEGGFLSCSTSMSRENSFRSTKSDGSGDGSVKPKRLSYDERKESSSRVASLSSNAASLATETPPSTAPYDFFHETLLNPNLSAVFDEKHLLEQENAKMAQTVAQSSLWPREIGAKRRTKKYAEFLTLKDMGSGAYGRVRLSQHKDDPKYKVIIKCIDKERILVDTWVRDRKMGTIPSEIQIMNFLMNDLHPNVMRIVDFFEDDQYYYLETPLHGDPPAIDLFDFIEIKKDMSELEMKVIFRQITSALAHCHKHGIVHRDIKDENVIIDERGIVKLIDFGSAAYTRQGPFDVFVGTIDYAAPEVLNGKPYDGKPQDVWALGVLLYTLMYQENPYYNVDEIMEGDLRFPYVLSDAAVSLIRLILVRDINKRPSLPQILDHEWLKL